MRLGFGTMMVGVGTVMVRLGTASGPLMGVEGRARAKWNVSTGASRETRAQSFATAIRRRNY